jgi:hypothetical protein
MVRGVPGVFWFRHPRGKEGDFEFRVSLLPSRALRYINVSKKIIRSTYQDIIIS